jgi:hypothetical protein
LSAAAHGQKADANPLRLWMLKSYLNHVRKLSVSLKGDGNGKTGKVPVVRSCKMPGGDGIICGRSAPFLFDGRKVWVTREKFVKVSVFSVYYQIRLTRRTVQFRGESAFLIDDFLSLFRRKSQFSLFPSA